MLWEVRTDQTIFCCSTLHLQQQSQPNLLSLCVCGPGVDSYGRLTQPLGLRMAEFPLSPMFAKMLLESGGCGCSKEISTIAAMMQIQNVMVLPANQKKAAVSQDCPPQEPVV